jgi:hypothetical protein
MGKLVTKTNILILIIIGLAVLNISIVSSIVWHRYHGFHDRWQHEMPFRHGRMDMIIPQKLNFNADQKKKFIHVDTLFRKSSLNIINQLHQLRFSILNELKKPYSDTTKLLEYSKQVGNLHSNLKMNTINFYLDLKKICTPAQQDSLASFFLNLIEFDDMPPRPPHYHHLGKSLNKHQIN